MHMRALKFSMDIMKKQNIFNSPYSPVQFIYTFTNFHEVIFFPILSNITVFSVFYTVAILPSSILTSMHKHTSFVIIFTELKQETGCRSCISLFLVSLKVFFYVVPIEFVCVSFSL